MGVLADGSVVVGDGTTDPVAITAFTSSTGLLIHERGGLEINISAIADGGLVVGTGSGVMAIRTGVFTAGAAGFLKHEVGGLEFNLSAITTDQFLGGTSAGVIGIRTAAQVTTSLALTIGTNTQAWDANLDQIAALAPTNNNFIVGTGAVWALETPANVRASLGLVIGTDVQAFDTHLEDLAALTPAVGANEVMVSTGAGVWARESGATLRTSLGLTIGTDVQAEDPVLTDLAALTAVANNEVIVGTGTGTYAHESGATLRISLGLAIGTDVQADLDVPSQAEAEAGTATNERVWTAQRISQAIVELDVPQATQAALEAETNEDTYAPPDLIKHSPGVAKALVKWEQAGAHSITTSYNMTSVTDGGAVGDTDHLWNVDFSSGNYHIAGSSGAGSVLTNDHTTLVAGGVTTITRDITASGAAIDRDDNMMAVFGDQ